MEVNPTGDADPSAAGDAEAIDARTRANRENAMRSTGPRTEAGKRRSAQNALKHGGYASTSSAISAGALAEDQGSIDGYIADLIDALAPRDALEYRMAERIARLFLRGERTSRYEAAMIAECGSPLGIIGSRGEEAIHRASQRAVREPLDLVTRIEARNCTALQRELRLYERLKERHLEGDADPDN